jgi:MFS family permease
MGFVTILREVLSEDDMRSWGWRVPFLASVLLGVIGLYLRSQLHESEEFMKVKNRGAATSAAVVASARAEGRYQPHVL